ncbi:D-3-phosphoglycerate dehydrogenase-like protein [Dendryphion nanum]|uniref:D-3-phosphoglycerate dehydrogenase-like protein n=1 Tax=Dendryphion nanum TaxID=256645 RepID=A0A9P9J024_9PLEO|nr:D-3-phosphoglycerate dehydrogenase-like protein [Dendryphion nanum]
MASFASLNFFQAFSPKMSPSRTKSPDDSTELARAHNGKTKSNIYLLEQFPPQAIQHCQSLFNTILPDDPEIENWRENADSILVREKIISAEDIAKARRLRAIGKQGTGIDIIDQDACAKHGISILNTPGVNAQSVAELVLSLTMAIARQLRDISVKQAAGLEVRKEHCCGTTLIGKTVGIVGMGNIGSAVARMFRGAFGASIYACDPFAPDDIWTDIPHSRVRNWEEMLPHVDVLTLHVPLNAETRGLVGAVQLRSMRPGSILINVARGGIVNENDLIIALEEGWIYGAGLDCHEEEPPTLQKYERLWATGKVVSTPHIGATTAETQVLTSTAAIDRVFKYLNSLS